MKMRCWLVLLGIASLGLPAMAVRVTVDGKPLTMRPKPVIRGRRVYVPVDAFRKIGLWVNWRNGSRHAQVGWPDTDFIVDFSVGRVWVEPLEGGQREFLPGRPFLRRGQADDPSPHNDRRVPTHRGMEPSHGDSASAQGEALVPLANGERQASQKRMAGQVRNADLGRGRARLRGPMFRDFGGERSRQSAGARTDAPSGRTCTAEIPKHLGGA